MEPIHKNMDKTQNSIFSLFSQEELILRRNETLLFKGVASDWSLENWRISDYDLLICLEGEAFYEDPMGTWRLTPGRAYLARPDFPVCTHLGKEKKFHVLAQHFSLNLPGGKDVLGWAGFRSSGRITVQPLVQEYVKRIGKGASDSFLSESLFRAILWDFLENNPARESDMPEGRGRSNPLSSVLELARKIKDINPEDRELEEMQGGMGFSSVYMRDQFKAHFGKTPRQYRREQRLIKARLLLKEGYSVKETAWRCGYTDELYFARLFKKREGISPGRFAGKAEI